MDTPRAALLAGESWAFRCWRARFARWSLLSTLPAVTTLVHGHRSARSGLELLAALTNRDLRLRDQGSLLGWAWSLIRPFALGLVLTFALGKVLGTGITAVFLLTGLFPWFWFQGSVQGAATTFVGNGGLLKKLEGWRAVLLEAVPRAGTYWRARDCRCWRCWSAGSFSGGSRTRSPMLCDYRPLPFAPSSTAEGDGVLRADSRGSE